MSQVLERGRELVSVKERLERERNNNNSEPITQILENGEEENFGQRNSIYHSDEVLPRCVVKIFEGEHPEKVREKVERAHPNFFPDAQVEVCDTDNINSELPTEDDKAVVVVENRSDYSIEDSDKAYEEILESTVGFVDGMVRNGQIIDDFKLEEIHVYGDSQKYVDFEDKRAIKDWPLLTDPSTEREVTYRMARMYANLATGLTEKYRQDTEGSLETVKRDIVENSRMIDEEVYRNNGFVPDMIKYWNKEQ